jgi:hypothetical protein
MAYRLDFPAEGYDARNIRIERDGELCVAGDDRFILANIELPVVGSAGATFVWTCWVSLSGTSYERMQALWDAPDREAQEPAFGWLSNPIPTYEPTTLNLKSFVHTRPLGLRPRAELEPTAHPLAVEQRDGIGLERIGAIFHAIEAQQTAANRASSRGSAKGAGRPP